MTKRKCSFGVRGARNARRMRYRDSVLGWRDNSSSHSDVLDDTIRGGRGNATALSAPPSDHQDTRTVHRYDTRLRRGVSFSENTSFELNLTLYSASTLHSGIILYRKTLYRIITLYRTTVPLKQTIHLTTLTHSLTLHRTHTLSRYGVLVH
jgi:hypothetical protein